MTIRPIVRYPDPRLALPAQPVTVFDGALRELANDLLETMHAAPGIGITAPHIGISLRVVVLDLDPVNGARTYVNPEIIWASPEMIMHQEGSVSMPGVNDDIERHARVRIGYQDLDGNMQTEESQGLRAVCHQHEIDQLNGLFWIQRLSRLKRERLIKRFEKVFAAVRWVCADYVRRHSGACEARTRNPFRAPQYYCVVRCDSGFAPRGAPRNDGGIDAARGAAPQPAPPAPGGTSS